MREYILMFIVISFGAMSISGQNSNKYQMMIQEAERLYESDSFEYSAQIYESAFRLFKGEVGSNDMYNIACCYSLSEDVEKAFDYLFYIAEDTSIKYHRYWHIATDLDLDNLHDDERWEELMKIVIKNKNEYEGVEDLEIVRILDSVMVTDQRVRREYRKAIEEYGQGSEEVEEAAKQMLRYDSLNLIKVGKILDENGWLGPDIIGRSGGNALFLTLQHADLETQLEYLPMAREAVKEGKLRGGAFALLEDRISLRQGKKQIYGSQIATDPETGERYVSPLIEPDKVNERRASVGLGPLEDYVKKYGINWNVESHIERIERMSKEN